MDNELPHGVEYELKQRNITGEISEISKMKKKENYFRQK